MRSVPTTTLLLLLQLLLALCAPAADADSFVERWLASALYERSEGERGADGGGLYAAEAQAQAQLAAWDREQAEEVEEEQDAGTDYVTEMLAAQARLRRRQQATQCTTVDFTAVEHATDGSEDFNEFVPAAGQEIEDGTEIEASTMSAAVEGGDFTCNDGYVLDETVTFKCEDSSQPAQFNGQPCRVVAPVVAPEEEEAEEEAEPRCPEDPACRADGATARFYAVFGGLVLFTCLVCFLKNHCGKDGDDAAKGDQSDQGDGEP